MASSRKITLRSSDGESFEVEQSVAAEWQTIKHMIEDNCADGVIPLPNVNSKILAKVIEYCKKHVESAAAAAAEDRVDDEDLEAWDADFVKVDQATLFDLLLAAHYLDIESLLDLTCQTVADIINATGVIKGKTLEEILKIFGMENEVTPEEIRRMCGIENDFTPGEEEEEWRDFTPEEEEEEWRKILWRSYDMSF